MSHHEDDTNTSSCHEEVDDDDFVDLNDPDLVIASDRSSSVADDDNDIEDIQQGIEPTEKEPEIQESVAFIHAGHPLYAVDVFENTAVFGCENDTAIVAVIPGEPLQAKARGAEPIEITPSRVLSGHNDTVNHVSFSPNGKTLATGSMDCTVKLWDVTNEFELMHTLSDLSGEVECLLWHPSSMVLLGGGADALAVLWNVAKGTPAQWFAAHRGSVLCAAWTQDVKKLATGSGDGSVVIYNPKTGEADHNFDKDMSPEGAGVCQLVMLTSDAIIAGCEDGSLHVLSIARRKVAHHLPEVHSQAIETIALHPTLGMFVTGGCDCTVVIWNTAELSVRHKFKFTEGITNIQWGGPSGAWIFCGCTDGDVRFWDGRTSDGRVVRAIGHRRTVLCVHSGNDRIVTGSDDGTGRVYSVLACTKTPLAEPPTLVEPSVIAE